MKKLYLPKLTKNPVEFISLAKFQIGEAIN